MSEDTALMGERPDIPVGTHQERDHPVRCRVCVHRETWAPDGRCDICRHTERAVQLSEEYRACLRAGDDAFIRQQEAAIELHEAEVATQAAKERLFQHLASEA